MSLRRSLRGRSARDDHVMLDSNASVRSTRLSRTAASSPSVTVHRSSSESPEGPKRSFHLTLKMPSNKLREVAGGSARNGASTRRSVNVFTENPIITGPRSSRARRPVVEVNTSDDDDLEDQEEDEVDEEDAPGEVDDDVDGEADADGDLDMDDAPPQPPVPKRHAKAAATSGANGKTVKAAEMKEMEFDDEDDDDEDDLSDPDTDAEGEPDDQEEGIVSNTNGGEELDDEEEEDEDEDLDSDDDGIRNAGDTSRMTKRQRGNLGNDFLQLPMEPQVKKHLTAEERAMRRAEMARRRKNLSEKRNEEEKMDTINRLLRKQAPKRRGRIPAGEAAEAASADQEMVEPEKADPTMVRWVSGREGSRVGVPEEWFGTPAGRIFGDGPRKLVEEL